MTMLIKILQNITFENQLRAMNKAGFLKLSMSTKKE